MLWQCFWLQIEEIASPKAIAIVQVLYGTIMPALDKGAIASFPVLLIRIRFL